mgnify:CR=1 FL=1
MSAETIDGLEKPDVASLNSAWPTISLGDVVALVSDSVDPKSVSHLRYVGLEHIEPGTSRLSVWGAAGEVRSAKTRFRRGDILYGKLRPYLDKAVLAEWEGFCSTDILVLRPTAAVSGDFIVNLLHTRSFIHHAVSTTAGVNHPRTSWSSLRESRLPIPPLADQRAIAHVLRTVQRAIEAAEAVIAAARELKRSLMQHLFTYGPVPVAEAGQVALKETEIGRVPEHWEVARLGVVVDVVSGGTPDRSRPEYWHGGISWVKSGEIDYHRINATVETISEQGLKNSSARLIPAGTLLMAMYGQGITRGRVALLGIDAAINQACAALIAGAMVSPGYLFFVLTYHYDRVRDLGHGANQKNLSALLIKSVVVPLPPESEQQETVRILSAVDQRITAEHRRKQSLDTLFKSLLERLMTGALRVGSLP